MPIRRVCSIAALLCLPFAIIACDDDETGPDEDEFIALLDASNEVPPTTEAASGIATFEDEGDEFEYRITVDGLSNVTAAHIHIGELGVNGGIIVPLFGTPDPTGSIDGELVSDTFDESDIQTLPGAAAPMSLDSLRTLMQTGDVYVNVHTTEFPAGAIRGQIVRN